MWALFADELHASAVLQYLCSLVANQLDAQFFRMDHNDYNVCKSVEHHLYHTSAPLCTDQYGQQV